MKAAGFRGDAGGGIKVGSGTGIGDPVGHSVGNPVNLIVAFERLVALSQNRTAVGGDDLLTDLG